MVLHHKTEESRYVFVIGIIENKLHCIKLNPINPLHFTQLIGKLRDKDLPLSSDLRLELMLKNLIELVINYLMDI